mmetsp:Transcript_6289/g.18066  ORF Transcript_6289/g.18066 Transcript_6289/m.18066 type:complete len:220 (-) Transcript_6289:1051-1710(-)
MTPAMTAMEVMDSSWTILCFVDCSLCTSFCMKPDAYCIIRAFSNSSPKDTKADIAMEATRSTWSSNFVSSIGITVVCHESWNCGAWSLASWPRACSAAYRTLGCSWSVCAISNFAISLTCSASSTYSTVCFTAVSAANLACHCGCWLKRPTRVKSAELADSMPMASTTRSMASSPKWYSSSASSSPSSSSMRSAHSLSLSMPSSTSSIKSMQHSMTRGA